MPTKIRLLTELDLPEWVDKVFGIADTNAVQINAADVALNDYAKFTATGLVGRSYAEVLGDIGGAAASVYPATGLTTGYLPYKSATVLANSPIFTDGTGIRIGTTTTVGTIKFGTGEQSIITTAGNIFGIKNWGGSSYADVFYALGGNVGIGTTNPTLGKLQVTGSSTAMAVTTTDNTTPYLFLVRNTGANGVSALGLTDGGNLYFTTGATGFGETEKMRILGNGSVAIATTNPRGYKLYVNGTGFYNGALTIAGALSGATTIAASGIVTALGLTVKQGANGKCGTFTANGATPVTVSNTGVAISDAIIISLNTVGGTVGALPAIATITAATRFTVVATAGDTSVYNYTIISNVA